MRSAELMDWCDLGDYEFDREVLCRSVRFVPSLVLVVLVVVQNFVMFSLLDACLGDQVARVVLVVVIWGLSVEFLRFCMWFV